MVTKNDVTGDAIQTKVSSKAYLNNYDSIFNKKDFKTKQKELTELNWDGNEDRGRYGEDESTQNKVSSGTVR